MKTSYSEPTWTPKVPFAGVGPATMIPIVLLSNITKGLTRSPSLTDQLASGFNPLEVVPLDRTFKEGLDVDLTVVRVLGRIDEIEDKEDAVSVVGVEVSPLPKLTLLNHRLCPGICA